MHYDNDLIYKVVVNHEEQYSIFLENKLLPNGWTDFGKRGTKQECLEFISSIWLNMCPLSIR